MLFDNRIDDLSSSRWRCPDPGLAITSMPVSLRILENQEGPQRKDVENDIKEECTKGDQ